MITLPLWITPEAWDEYANMRKRIKKPLTELGARRLLNRCNELHAKGHDPSEALLVAADMHWHSVYPPKDMTIEAKAGESGLRASQEWADEFKAAKRQATPPPAKVLAMRSRRA
jgi:hypothetical protein